MKLTENTRLRVRVPKHLYEAIQAELDKKHGMEEMEVPKDGHKKMEEEEVNEITGAQMDAEKIGKLIADDPFTGGLILVGAVVTGAIAAPKAIQLVKASLAVAADKGEETLNKVKALFSKSKENPKVAGVVDAGMKGGEMKEGDHMEYEAYGHEDKMEEAIDLETLMEAVKDAAKKKVEEKKKKEAEAKKKKEAEAKKKADAKKK